jgi:hypothetical protein
MGINISQPYDKEIHRKQNLDTPYCNSFMSETQGEFMAKQCCLDNAKRMAYFDDCLNKELVINTLMTENNIDRAKAEEELSNSQVFSLMLTNTNCEQKEGEFADYRRNFDCKAFLQASTPVPTTPAPTTPVPTTPVPIKTNNMLVISLGILVLIIIVLIIVLMMNKNKTNKTV